MSALIADLLLFVAVPALAALYVAARSVVVIGPNQVGLVTKRVSRLHNITDTPVAFAGEAGYQADLLMPGVRFKLWPNHTVALYPWVQVPAGEIGVVISQIGERLPTGAKSAVYRPEFGNFTDLCAFVNNGGQKGVQRPVLPPGTLVPVHPVAFLVITATKAYGLPVDRQLLMRGPLSPEAFGLQPHQLRVTLIAPQGDQDVVGIVTTLDGAPLPPADIAGRIGGFADIEALEKDPQVSDSELIEKLPTFIIPPNWAEASSVAHNLDAQLSPIEGKSREGFVFSIDLQVQIHVPDTKAPKVISMVGSMQNLVNEVLQAAVGNHFRNTLQGLEAVRFIETRDQVQAAALEAISRYLAAYEVETRGVYIQDVTFPEELVIVLTRR